MVARTFNDLPQTRAKVIFRLCSVYASASRQMKPVAFRKKQRLHYRINSCISVANISLRRSLSGMKHVLIPVTIRKLPES